MDAAWWRDLGEVLGGDSRLACGQGMSSRRHSQQGMPRGANGNGHQSRPGRRVPDRQCTATARNPSLWGDDPAVGRYRECADGVPRWELKARANSDHRRQLAGSDALVFTRRGRCAAPALGRRGNVVSILPADRSNLCGCRQARTRMFKRFPFWESAISHRQQVIKRRRQTGLSRGSCASEQIPLWSPCRP
ncbi:hypothetical protein BT67DRAFT_310162 [Trichocladium antarcticum]|uniref:Uncharacterized protein n=1 Tax=Trichocladium antarcticum TaxID=1450529 RepID=A0AAN6UJZ3_9PEZI|nr:hypothetical protein BT67DRAFT_310162 [Trichocladium antarcticum]